MISIENSDWMIDEWIFTLREITLELWKKSFNSLLRNHFFTYNFTLTIYTLPKKNIAVKGYNHNPLNTQCKINRTSWRTTRILNQNSKLTFSTNSLCKAPNLMQNVSRQAMMLYLILDTDKELTNSLLLASDWLTILFDLVWQREIHRK